VLGCDREDAHDEFMLIQVMWITPAAGGAQGITVTVLWVDRCDGR
jgi:hypothetical protein